MAVGEGRLNGEDPDGIAAAVTDYLTERGWTVHHHRSITGVDGYTDPTTRRVVIESSLSRPTPPPRCCTKPHM